MRKLFLLLTISLLFQSCFSYKRVELNPKTMVIGQKYKIEQNHKTSKVVYNGFSDSSIIVSKHWKEVKIPLKEITSVRKRKFSVVKTIALVPITVASIVLLVTISNPGFGRIQSSN